MTTPYSIESETSATGRRLGIDRYAVVYEAARRRAGLREQYVVTDHLDSHAEAMLELLRLNEAHRCECPTTAAGPWECLECPVHGAEAAEDLAAQHKSEIDAENGWLRAAEAGYPGYDDDPRELALEANDPQLNGTWR